MTTQDTPVNHVAAKLGLGTAANLAAADLATGEPDRLRGLRDELGRRLAEQVSGRAVLNGHPTQRYPTRIPGARYA